MNPRGWIVLAACILIAMGAVWWLGQEYSNEARAFLRGLRRIL